MKKGLTGISLRLVALASVLAASSTAQAQVYYRIDTGYSKSFGADFKDKDANNFLICGDAACNTPGSLDDFGSSVVLGAGVGYRYNANLRGDLTLAYRPTYKLDASDKGSPAARFKADVKSLALMANGYYDFPLAGWTPYVGAGLGYAQNRIDSISFDDGAGFSGTAPGGTKSGVAWALMAGAAIPVSDRWTLDVGYRYIDLGKVESGSGTITVGGFSGPYAGASGKLKANELYVGVRF